MSSACTIELTVTVFCSFCSVFMFSCVTFRAATGTVFFFFLYFFGLYINVGNLPYLFVCRRFVLFCFILVCLSCNFSFLVPFREPPRYKPGRRGSRKSFYGDQRVDTPGRLPSPSLSLRSLCPFSSASSSLSETSSASGGSNSASYISNNTGETNREG